MNSPSDQINRFALINLCSLSYLFPIFNLYANDLLIKIYDAFWRQLSFLKSNLREENDEKHDIENKLIDYLDYLTVHTISLIGNCTRG